MYINEKEFNNLDKYITTHYFAKSGEDGKDLPDPYYKITINKNRCFDSIKSAKMAAYYQLLDGKELAVYKKVSCKNVKNLDYPYNIFVAIGISLDDWYLDDIVGAFEERANYCFKKVKTQERNVEIFYERMKSSENNVKTLKQISEKYGVTRERIRQIEEHCLAILKEFKNYLITGTHVENLNDVARKEVEAYLSRLKDVELYKECKKILLERRENKKKIDKKERLENYTSDTRLLVYLHKLNIWTVKELAINASEIIDNIPPSKRAIKKHLLKLIDDAYGKGEKSDDWCNLW